MYAKGDDDVSVAAEDLYKCLSEDTRKPPTSEDATVGLNIATGRLGEMGVPLFRWVSRFVSIHGEESSH